MYESYQSEFSGEPQPEVLGMPFASNQQPMWISDRGSHVFLDVNDAALRQYGYSRKQFLTLSTFDLRTKSKLGSKCPIPYCKLHAQQSRICIKLGTETFSRLRSQVGSNSVLMVAQPNSPFRGKNSHPCP